MSARRRLVAAALAAIVTGAGCGEDRSGAGSTATDARTGSVPPPARPPVVATVTEREFAIDPARIRIDRPATVGVRVRNRGRTQHALSIEGPSGTARTRVLAPGSEAVLEIELDAPGRYRWLCPLGDHRLRGMRGWVEVAPRGRPRTN